jgi:ubiquinone/menaquinone biosynthesis C-methylase UbiE
MRLESTPDGLVMHSALEYDLRSWWRTRGRERRFRDELVARARVAPGERVLDVGCATGSLALAAKRRAGETGLVHAVDPSSRMVAYARWKAALSRRDVAFATATAQELPYRDAAFDVVLSTLVLHQLPHDGLRAAIEEMRRVVRPGGRLFLADIDPSDPTSPRDTPHSHGRFDVGRIGAALERMGLELVDGGRVEFRLARFERIRYLLARV